MDTDEIREQMPPIASSLDVRSSIRGYIESQAVESWVQLKEVIKICKTNNYLDDYYLSREIENSLRYVRSLPTFFYIYFLCNEHQLRILYYEWRQLYNKFIVAEKELEVFVSILLVEKQNIMESQLFQQTLRMIVQIYPIFVKQQRVRLDEYEFNLLITFPILTKSRTAEQLKSTIALIEMIKSIRIFIVQDFLKKEHIIYKKVLEIISQNKESSGCTHLFLTNVLQNQIEYFFHIYSDFLENLVEENYINIFYGLSCSCLTRESVSFLYKISYLLMNNEQFYILRKIYEKVLLPVIIRNYKCMEVCSKSLYQISQLYLNGLYKHLQHDEKAARCLVKDIQKIKDKSIQSKWIMLVLLILKRNPHLQQFIFPYFEHQNIQYKDISVQNDLFQNQAWNVTLKSGRKLKKYTKKPCNDFIGIRNDLNNCYIISTIQGLFTTGHLPSLLYKYSSQIYSKKLLNQLLLLFEELRDKKHKAGTVEYLKRSGPEIFALTETQEDAQQYLILLFELIENQMKAFPALLKDFKQIFSTQMETIIRCSKCTNQIKKQEETYIFTVPHNEPIKLYTEEIISDYNCEQCQESGESKIIRNLMPSSEVLIIHMNRFAIRGGKTIKQLSNQAIRRNILEYQLKGMIFHIGRTVEKGHYIYFCKVDDKKWVQMDDTDIQQFSLQSPDEEFQQEFKAEMTPYLLFYVK